MPSRDLIKANNLENARPDNNGARSESSERDAPETPATPVTTGVLPTANRAVSRIIFSDNGASSYHGRTSALYEETGADRWGSKKDNVPAEWVEKALIAEASLQRQCHSTTIVSCADKC
jgi:hypothetical protein